MRAIKVITTIILVAILLLAGGIFWVGYKLKVSTAVVTDASRYQEILAHLRGTDGGVEKPLVTLAHFPGAIPSDATNVRFFYQPHFLQGGPVLQLRMALPENEIKQAIEGILPATRPTTEPEIFFHIADNADLGTLPADFRIYVLGVNHSLGTNGREYEFGVAVSAKRNEIVYWFEQSE
jgi:hypothetical protein